MKESKSAEAIFAGLVFIFILTANLLLLASVAYRENYYIPFPLRLSLTGGVIFLLVWIAIKIMTGGRLDKLPKGGWLYECCEEAVALLGIEAIIAVA